MPMEVGSSEPLPELTAEQRSVVDASRRPAAASPVRRAPAAARRSPRGSSRLAAEGPPERVLVLCRSRAGAARLRGARRGRASIAPYERALGRRPTRRSPSACCASTRSRPGSTRSSRPSRSPTGWRCCSTGSTSCRFAGTRSAATRPASSPGCCSGSTSLKAEAVTPGGPARLGGRACERAAPTARASASAPSASSSSPTSTRATSGCCATAGSLDAADLVLELGRAARPTATICARSSAARFEQRDRRRARGGRPRRIAGCSAARRPAR